MSKQGLDRGFQRFAALWAGQFVSSIGSGLTSFGLGVYVFQQTGQAAASSLIMLLGMLPGLLLSPFAGVLADRYDRRLLMVLGDGLSALGLIWILWCLRRGEALLWQIALGVTISSVFSALMEPAYKATVTDLLSSDQYEKASGMVQMAGAARYLISPVLAGWLLSVSDIRLLLILDIATFILTVLTTLNVRRGLPAPGSDKRKDSFFQDLLAGARTLGQRRGVWVLVLMSALMTFLLAFIQTLSTPLMLAFTDSKTLGRTLTIAASGMLVGGFAVSVIKLPFSQLSKLCVSLGMAGLFMALFGLKENLLLMTVSSFLFFAMLPFANGSMDYLMRTNIDPSAQGRAWGLISLISQLGYVVGYPLAGLLADKVFTPLLLPGGALEKSLGGIYGLGEGRGTGLLIGVAGLCLIVGATLLCHSSSVRTLNEEGGQDAPETVAE